MTKHTPGPWHWIETDTGTVHVIAPARGMVIAVCSTMEPFSPEQRANAIAMTAAPDLLSAAKEVMAALEEHGPSIVPHLMDTDENAGQRLRDAIAKAEPTK